MSQTFDPVCIPYLWLTGTAAGIGRKISEAIFQSFPILIHSMIMRNGLGCIHTGVGC